MVKTIWTGRIAFGLVTIPVKAYATARDHSTPFRLLHKTCEEPVQQRWWCPTHYAIEWNDIVRGVKTGHQGKHTYIALTDEDLAALPTTDAIQITGFVPEATVASPERLERAYWLGPDTGGETAYAVLRRVLRSGKLAAVGTMIMRGRRERLAAVVCRGTTLMLWHLHWPDEIESPMDIPGTSPDIVPQETHVKIARELVMALMLPNGLGDFTDGTETAIQAMVTRKTQRMPPTTVPAGTLDLTEALQQSLENIRTRVGRRKKRVVRTWDR